MTWRYREDKLQCRHAILPGPSYWTECRFCPKQRTAWSWTYVLL